MQIAELLGWLATLSTDPFERRATQPTCDHDPRPWWTDAPGEGSTEFLRRLTHFTTTHVYETQRPLLDALLHELGVPQDALAALLHLMGLHPDQEQDVVHRWAHQVGPHRSAGGQQDLPHYMAYKRVQSVCTDVLRAASRLAESQEAPGTPEGDRRARGAAAAVRKALLAAREPLGLTQTPRFEAVEAVYQEWWRARDK
ncbi:hypothetical protein V2S66_27730 [Streptomyces sp. V4-01]|uniref:HD domain-containing protein n=1 Tax=Actinacidiphila polyblastidii TaxID=3110430 RepID=A0ABU7PIU4_9ACTN|nr:hypothetical protein [Streptomyces sp. V4-01]